MQVSFTSPAVMWHRMAEITKLLFKSARVSVEFTRDGWTAVFFIPLSTLKAEFIPAHFWRVNFARNGQPWSMLPGNSDLSLPESYGTMDIK